MYVEANVELQCRESGEGEEKIATRRLMSERWNRSDSAFDDEKEGKRKDDDDGDDGDGR